jgi:transcriptional regulator with XRE-family HTH domain
MKPEEIKALREALHLTQVQFASILGKHALTVNEWEFSGLRPGGRSCAMLQLFQKAVDRRPKNLPAAVHLALQHGGPIFALYQLLKWAIEPDHILGIDKGPEE